MEQMNIMVCARTKSSVVKSRVSNNNPKKKMFGEIEENVSFQNLRIRFL